MLSQISWSQYLIFILVGLVVYYLYVLLRFYREKIRGLFSSTESQPKTKIKNAINDNDEDFVAAKQLIDDISNVIQHAASVKYVREELIMAISKEVKIYPKLKGTAFQIAVNNKIGVLVSNVCGIDLSDEDLQRLW